MGRASYMRAVKAKQAKAAGLQTRRAISRTQFPASVPAVLPPVRPKKLRQRRGYSF